MKQKLALLTLLLCAVLLVVGWALPSWTAFTYQGRLNDGGSPANGSYDMQFTLYYVGTNLSYTIAAGPFTDSAVSVTNGLFTTTLDFGGSVFNGNLIWLEIGVRTNGDTNGFAILSPMQGLTPAPYAIFANTASNLSGTLPAAQLAGTLPASAFTGYTNTVALTNSANLFSGTFSGIFSGTFGGAFNGTFNGNGGNVTNVNVTNLTGVLADNQLPANTAFVNSNQTFTGANTFTGVDTFTNLGNSFSGSFFGNGLVGWIPTNGTAIQAARDTGYLLTNSQLVTVTLPASPGVGDIVRISGAGAGGWLVQESSGQSILGNFASYSNSSPVTLPTSATSGNYQDVAASADGTRMYAVGGGFSGVQVSSDAGHTWNNATASFSLSCLSVACSANGRIVYAVTTADAVYKSTDSGATWTQIIPSGVTAISCTADGSQYFANVDCSGNGTYRAEFTTSSILVSTNSGGSYSVNVPVPSANLSCLAVSGDCTRLVAGVTNGLLYASANLGATWTSITTSNQVWSGAWMSEDGSKFAATVSTHGSTSGGVYNYAVHAMPGTISTNSTISGSQGTAVELQYIGNNQWMPVSSAGTIWAY
ncbi:MAG: sialidase family protein [Verrucomicrobiia bacterium]